MDYTLKFKKYPSERGYWYTNITADNKREAIKEAKELISGGYYYKSKLIKLVTSERVVWKDE